MAISMNCTSGRSAACARTKYSGSILRLATLLAVPRRVNGFVDCSQSPDCTSLRRQVCNPEGVAPNACGDCWPGAYGFHGPSIAPCLAEGSCGMIFPDSPECNLVANVGIRVPFVIPYDKCVCDQDGSKWPTANGWCATIRFAQSYYRMFQCKSSTCGMSSCTEIASWSPMSRNLSLAGGYPCRIYGFDALMLSDGCAALSDMTGGNPSPSSFCGHAGTIAKVSSLGQDGQLAVPEKCQLAPQCPSNVLSTVRLEQTCCSGTAFSNALSAEGFDTKEQAPAFCDLGGPPPLLGRGTTTAGPTGACAVRTSAPGWRGCACMDSRGLPMEDKVCTVECVPPDCPLPDGGNIPTTPENWITAPVPRQPPGQTAGDVIRAAKAARAANDSSRTRSSFLVVTIQFACVVGLLVA